MKYPSASDGVMISMAIFMSKMRAAPVGPDQTITVFCTGGSYLSMLKRDQSGGE